MEIIEVRDVHRNHIDQVIKEHWNGPMIASMGKVSDTRELPGYICVDDDVIAGFVLYSIDKSDCEITVIESGKENHGVGTALINAVIDAARKNSCKRVWLVTTNDNTHAIRFYQRKGFSLKAVHIDSIEKLRKIKPEIAQNGNDNIPILHEFEFEIVL